MYTYVKKKRTKLDNNSFVCVLTSVSGESKGYRLINLEAMKVVISNDVIFEKNKGWDWSKIEENRPKVKNSHGETMTSLMKEYIFIDEHDSKQIDELEQQGVTLDFESGPNNN